MKQLQQILDKLCQIEDYVAVVAHGEFPKEECLINKIKKAKQIICCDGAIVNLLKYKIIPDYIIGDCDSLPIEIHKKFKDKIIRIPEQQTNDLTKAVNFVVQQLNQSKILIFAATGLREDHTLANISLLINYTKQTKELAMISEYGIFTVHNGNNKISTIPGEQISLFCPNPNTAITSSGLKWELSSYYLDYWYKGTLNQALGDYIELLSNGTVIVYRAFTIKS